MLKARYRALATESILTSIIFPPSTGPVVMELSVPRIHQCDIAGLQDVTWRQTEQMVHGIPLCYFLQGHVNLQLGQNNKLNLFF